MNKIQWTTKHGDKFILDVSANGGDEFIMDLKGVNGWTCSNLTRDAALLLHGELSKFLAGPEGEKGTGPCPTGEPIPEPAPAETGTQIIGKVDQTYALTPEELRTLADTAEKVEALGVMGGLSFNLFLDGQEYHLTFGWDETGTFGLLAARMAD
jgi:hypothetical protein